MTDKVNPNHYWKNTDFETRKIIEAWYGDKDYYLASVIKYVSRFLYYQEFEWENVDIKDLYKAREFLNYKIEKLEK